MNLVSVGNFEQLAKLILYANSKVLSQLHYCARDDPFDV